MESTVKDNESHGFYKLNWLQRIGFGSGDLAQNLIYQTIGMYLLLFYTNVFGLDPLDAAFMFLVVRIVDVLWDPVVGTFVDKHNPRWGKYRSYLILGGIPLSGFAILCFWDGFSGSLLYAYITYVGMSMCYTLVNVPYGALNSSLTRDTNEITVLTSVRMFLANSGGLIVSVGIPILVTAFSPDGKINTTNDANAWFITMTIYALAGLALLIFCFTQTKERVVMDASETAEVKFSDLWKEFVRNRPLRIVAFFFILSFTLSSVGNAGGSYYMLYNVHGTSSEMAVFMGLGSIPAFIFMPMVPAIKRRIGKKNMFYFFFVIAIIGMAILYLLSKPMCQGLADYKLTLPLHIIGLDDYNTNMLFMLVYIAQFIKSSGVVVATGYMWALVPEVVSYSEYTTGRRIAGIVNALTGIFFKAGMALGGVIPGIVLSIVGFDKTNAISQSPLAQEGILWLVCVIPALIIIPAMWVISKYELTDEVIDDINRKIEEREK